MLSSPSSPRSPLISFVIAIALLPGVVDGIYSGISRRWLIVSQPERGDIVFVDVPRGGGLRTNTSLQVLINGNATGILQSPMGIAVDPTRNRLFVADPVLKQIIAFRLSYPYSGGGLSATMESVWASGVEARWVAVDPSGDIFFTDETNNQVLTISLALHSSGNTSGVVLYDGAKTPLVNSPGGVAVDGLRVYWVNKQLGTSVGSVVSAWKVRYPGQPEGLRLLATNTDKSYGLCLSMKNLYYTQPFQEIYGVAASGEGLGGFTTITDRMTNPRGCTFDGDGTVYVADRGVGAVYSFPGNQQTLQAVLVRKLTSAQDAFGIAVYSDARRTRADRFVLAFWPSVALVIAAYS